VVVGSLAVSAEPVLVQAVQQFGAERLTIAVDVRRIDGQYQVMIKGWQERAGLAIEALLARLVSLGLKRILCTDIDRDGVLTGPNHDLYRELLTRFPGLELQASGGVTSLADLRALRAAGLHSAIVGRAWLSGQLALPEALRHAL
jgi:phosphoribosylformimino-5-aminoimidazole carboxamide ribotide isomerase